MPKDKGLSSQPKTRIVPEYARDNSAESLGVVASQKLAKAELSLTKSSLTKLNSLNIPEGNQADSEKQDCMRNLVGTIDDFDDAQNSLNLWRQRICTGKNGTQNKYRKACADAAASATRIQEKLATARKLVSEIQSAFANFDQRGNQLFTILTTILKTAKEMQAGLTRSMG
jgi:hypothetical protein